MNKRQKNKITMYKLTEEILNNNNSIWNSTPGFVSEKGSFSALITRITKSAAEQQSPVTGITTDKRGMKINLTSEAASMAGIVSTYAIDISNPELQAAVKFTQRTLFKCRDNKCATHCKNIYDLALTNAAALLHYGITPLKLNVLLTLINQFRAKTPAPRAALVHKQTIAKSLKEDFSKADKLLKLQLDNMVLFFRTTHSDFYLAYKAARQIIDRGLIHTRLRVLTKDMEGNILRGASVSLFQNQQAAYSQTTNDQGIALIPLVKPGIYDLKVQKGDYANWSQSEITFASGKKIRRTVVLSAA